MGIVSQSLSTPSADTMNNAKPSFTASVMPDAVRLDWTKGVFDGVVVQSKRGNETAFTALDNDTVSIFYLRKFLRNRFYKCILTLMHS